MWFVIEIFWFSIAYRWVVRIAGLVEAVTSFFSVAAMHFGDVWNSVDIFTAFINQAK